MVTPRRPRAFASPVSRRRFLGAASAVAVAAMAGACRRGHDGAAGTPTAAATPLAPVGSRGGIFRFYDFTAQQYDSLDPQLTQFGPIVAVHAAVFSRLLRYADERDGSLAPDLAAAMPEQPDETTYVIRLRDDARFHDTPRARFAFPKLAGRRLTSADVKFSLERQMTRSGALARRFFRQSDWSVIDRIEAPDASTVVIHTKAPTAPFLSFLAGRHAFVIAPESVARGGQISHDLGLVGTGPFALDGLETGVVARLRRNDSWFRRDDAADGVGGGRPFLDGYDAYFAPQEDTFQRVAFERQIVDATGFVDPASLDQERKTNLADIALDESDAGGVLAMRLLLDRPPFQDDRVRRALHLALDRESIALLLYPTMDGRPSARLSGPIAPAVARFALPQEDLGRRPGYRSEQPSRAEDLAEAKRLWDAAAGDAGIRELHITAAGIPRIIPERAADAIARDLRDALGVSVTSQTDPTGGVLIGQALGRNLESASEGVVGCTLMLEEGGVDLDDWLYPHFRSGQTMNTYRLQDPQLDAILDRTRTEFDSEARRRLGLDAQDYLLSKVNARLEICAPVQRRLAWGYVHNASLPMWYGSERLEDAWMDTTHAAWRTRPA